MTDEVPADGTVAVGQLTSSLMSARGGRMRRSGEMSSSSLIIISPPALASLNISMVGHCVLRDK